MRITCPNCQATYEVGAADIPEEGIEVECSACLKHWMQMPESEATPDKTVDRTASGASAPVPDVPSPAAADSTALSAPSIPAPDPQDLRQALLDNTAPPVSPAADYMAPPSDSAPSFSADSAVEPPVPTPSFSAPSAAAPSGPAAAGHWRVPTPPTKAMLEQDPLDEILADINARVEADDAGGPLENASKAESAPEEDRPQAAADHAADKEDEPPMQAAETAPAAPPMAEDIITDAPAHSHPDTPVRVEESAEPQAVSGPSFGDVAVEDTAPEAPSAPEGEAVRDIPPSLPGEGDTPPVAAMPSAPSAPESSAPSAPDAEAILGGFVEQDSEVNTTPPPSQTFESPDPAQDLALQADQDHAELKQDAPDDADESPAAPQAEQPQTGAEPVAQQAPKAAAHHWSEVVSTPSAPPTAEAQQGMEAFIRELKEEMSGASEDPAAPDPGDDAAVDTPVDEESEAVFHPWEGETAPEMPAESPAPEESSETSADLEQPLADDQVIETLDDAFAPAAAAMDQAEAPSLAPSPELPDGTAIQEELDEAETEASEPTEAASAVEPEDDFEWEENPDPEGPELEAEAPFIPDAQEDAPKVVEQLAVQAPPSDVDLRLKPPEISNVVQANIPQAPASTMGQPVTAPVETPRKPTPVEATEDIEAAIRAQISNFPKKNMSAPKTVQPEKKSLFGKKDKKAAAAPQAPATSKPVDPLKAALMDTDAPKKGGLGKRAGFVTVMVLFVLLAVLYVLGDSLSAMVPALAPVISGLSGVVDALRGVVGAILGG